MTRLRLARTFATSFAPTFIRPWLLCGTLLCAMQAAHAGSCAWQSPPHRQGLLELYTSEGCSSCPPADRWLSSLRASLRADRLVPLAFHVDYWNQLGWPDRFSRAQFTRRQQDAADRNRAAFVYTPQFLLDGKDFRPLHSPDLLSARLAALDAEIPQARISARARIDGAELLVEGRSVLGGPLRSAETFIAVYEHGLTSKVARGENAGKSLRHDYVVRSLAGPIGADANGIANLTKRIALPADARAEHLGIAVFTQDRGNGRVLQAASAEGCLGGP